MSRALEARQDFDRQRLKEQKCRDGKGGAR